MNKDNKKVPSFDEFVTNESVFGNKRKETPFEKGKREREESEREAKINVNNGVEVLDEGENERKGENKKEQTSFKNLYVGSSENGYYKLPMKFSMLGMPTFVGKPQYKSYKTDTLYSHLLCTDDTVLHFVGNGLVNLVGDNNDDDYDNDESTSLSAKEQVAKALVNTPYFDSENDTLVVTNPNLTKGKIYVGKHIFGDKVYSGLFSNCVEIIDDAGISIIAPMTNFIIPKEGEFTKEEQEAAIANDKVIFKPLSTHVGHKVNDKNLEQMELDNAAAWKDKLRESNVIDFEGVDAVVKNLNVYNKYNMFDVPNQTVEAYNGDEVVVPGDMIFYVRYQNNATNSRCVTVFPKTEENDNLGEVAFVDLIFINEVFGSKQGPDDSSMILYSKEQRMDIYKNYKNKRYYNMDRDQRRIKKQTPEEQAKRKALKGDKALEYDGKIIIKSFNDVPTKGPRTKSVFKNKIGYDIDTLQLKHKKGNELGEVFEFTLEMYDEYKAYYETFFTSFYKANTSGRKSTKELKERQVIFPEIPKAAMKNDVRYKFLMDNFNSHSDYSRNSRVYEMESRSTFWFLARFYNEFVLPSPVIQLMTEPYFSALTIKAYQTPFEIPNDIDWGEVINNYSVAMNKTNVFADIFYNNGKHITSSRFPFKDGGKPKESSWKRAKELKDYSSRLDTGETDSKGKKVYGSSDFTKDAGKYLSNKDKYVECLVKTRGLLSFDSIKPLGLFELPLPFKKFTTDVPKKAYYDVLQGKITMDEFHELGGSSNNITSNDYDENQEDNF